jgi:hypothetical protein
VNLQLKKAINDDEPWDTWATSGWENSGDANDTFFAEEEYDDEYDPFFDE